MRTQDLAVTAADDLVLHGTAWLPDAGAAVRGAVLIVHGMAEHSARYAEFAGALAAAGYAVYGYDQRGHGRTATENGLPYGHFADRHGWELVLSDIDTMREHVAELHPGTPLVVFGHSMGSLLTRVYLQRHGGGLAGAIICGTGGDPGPLRLVGLTLARAEARLRGRRTPSPLLEKLTFGAFNKPFEADGGARTGFDWLSRDEAAVDAYVADEACGFTCTTQFYADLLGGIAAAHDPRRIAQVPLDVPVLFVFGRRDPVGANGVGAERAAGQFAEAGVRDVQSHEYADARHEVLNETNRADVTRGIVDWLDQHTPTATA